MKHFIGALGLIAIALPACQASSHPRPATSLAEPAHGDEQGANQPPPSAATPSLEEQEAPQEGANADRDSSPSSEEESRFRLALPANSEFLSRAGPPAEPSAYAQYRSLGLMRVGHGYLDQLSLAADGRLLFAMSDSEAQVRVYDRNTRQLLVQHACGGSKFDTAALLAWEPEGRKRISLDASSFFMLGDAEGVRLYEALSGELHSQVAAIPARRLAWSDDSEILMIEEAQTGPKHFTLHFLKRSGPDSLTSLGKLDFDTRIDAWALSPDQRMLAVAHYASQELEVIELASGRSRFRINAPSYTNSLDFSPDGRALVAGGAGLLWVDLLSPERRAFYSHFNNNLHAVAFSPSSDAIAASSYDGKIRLFSVNSMMPELQLLTTLRHAGSANVYALQFEANGRRLFSSSGDQTIRVFGPANASERPAQQPEAAPLFHSLDEWKQSLAPAALRVPPRVHDTEAPYRSPLLDAPARPSSIKPGHYSCRVSTHYKYRDCTVRLDSEGRSILHFAPGNLLALHGVLYDDGSAVRYDAWLSEGSSIYSCKGCEKQALHGVFRGASGRFSGLLLMRAYYDPRRAPPLPATDIKFEEAEDRLSLSLRFRAPFKDAPPPPRPQESDTAPPRTPPAPQDDSE